LTQVKPDAWDPTVSVLGLVRVTDMWAESTATSAWSKLTRGPIVVRLKVNRGYPMVNLSGGAFLSVTQGEVNAVISLRLMTPCHLTGVGRRRAHPMTDVHRNRATSNRLARRLFLRVP